MNDLEYKLVFQKRCLLTDFLRDTFSKDLSQSAFSSVELLGSVAKFEDVQGLRQESVLEVTSSSFR